jgi:hypothetical protein
MILSLLGLAYVLIRSRARPVELTLVIFKVADEPMGSE